MTEEKMMIFDASSLISFAINGLLHELIELRKIFNGKFIITNEVKSEIIDRPLTIKRFELEALKLKKLLDDKIIELPSAVGISDDEISRGTTHFLNLANTTFYEKQKNINLIHLGEASCLALSRIFEKKGIMNVIVIDERTTRMLCEKPENLRKLFEDKLKTKITSNKNNYPAFEGLKLIRSAELIYVLYKKNLSRWNDSRILDAMLWAVKFKGCAISEKEIQEIKAIG